MASGAWADKLAKNDPALTERLNALDDFVTSEGALPQKIKTLMCMVVDSLLAHPKGVEVLAERARGQGASEAEIAETVRMAFFFGGVPALVTAANAFKDE